MNQSPKTLDTRIAGQTSDPIQVDHTPNFVITLSRTDKRNPTILSAADWIDRIAQRHSELSKLFLDGFSKEEFEVLARNLREITK